MEGWVGLVGWSIADTLPAKWSHISYRSGVDQGKLKTDVLTTPPAVWFKSVFFFQCVQIFGGTLKWDVRCRRTPYLRCTHTTRRVPPSTRRRCCQPSSSHASIPISLPPAVASPSRRLRPPPLFRHTSTTPPSPAAATSLQVRGPPAAPVTSLPCRLPGLRPFPVTTWWSLTLSRWWPRHSTATGTVFIRIFYI